MDGLAAAGALLGLAAILLGQLLEGGHVSSLINGPAFLIVVGGAAGAVMLQSTPAHLRRALFLLRWVFFPPQYSYSGVILKINNWSGVARKSGLLGLEDAVEMESDPFIRKGLQMLVDGRDPVNFRAAMELEIISREEFDMASAKLFESMGGYTPTIGILGAVMGLIHVMENLSEPARLGAGIATAFVATIYGVGLANLILLPMANRLKTLVLREAKYREMILEGLASIATGENPRNIESKLNGFIL